MAKILKYSTLFFIAFLTTTMFAMAVVNAQDEPTETIPPDQFPSVPNPNVTPIPPATGETANVVIAASLGGTTNLAPGAFVYNYGSTIHLQATPNTDYKFLYWSISGSYAPGHNQPPVNYPENAINDPEFVPKFPSPTAAAQDALITSTNPLDIICGYGYTYVYQPIFTPITVSTETNSTDAIVTVVNSVGGTTTPGAGTYHYQDGKTIHLQATANSGYDFVYWVATDANGHPTTIQDNPTNIICGYGYTYTYQPMFAPTGSNTNNSNSSDYLYAIIVVLAVVAVIGVVAALVFRRRK